MRTTDALPAAAAATAVVMAAACGADAEEDQEPGSTEEPGPEPAPPVPEGTVTTQHPATVMDDDGTAELCLGAVAESYPPQCSGPELIDWEWEDQDPGAYTQEGEVRWGEFVVDGVYDPQQDTFDHESAVPAADWDGEHAGESVDFTTPCEEPEGGWEVQDPDLVSEELMYDTFQRAEELDDFAGSWMDQSQSPVQTEDLDDEDLSDEERRELEGSANDPDHVIINVRVTEDPDAAYDFLREEWGGMLCISLAERSSAELEEIQEEIVELDGVQAAGVDVTSNQLMVEVVYDDGSLQSDFDGLYGTGTVRVDSRLVEAQ